MERDASWAPQSPDLSSYHSAYEPEPILPQHQGYRGSISHPGPSSPPTSSPAPQHLKRADMPRVVKQEESVRDDEYVPGMTSKSRGKKKESNSNGAGASGGSTALPGTEDIVIKSHFPVARIKRIMQADDDVGKVAQVTPVVVSKALELFMISLVTKAAAEAKARNSKRVNTIHLKQAVTNDEQFDFLSEIVSKVADAPSAAEKNDPDAMDVDSKKKKSSSRRKKKVDDDDF